jgi:hypothetical protein
MVLPPWIAGTKKEPMALVTCLVDCYVVRFVTDRMLLVGGKTGLSGFLAGDYEVLKSLLVFLVNRR